MLTRLLNINKRLNHDIIIYYISFIYSLGIVFQGQSKIPLTFGIVFSTFFWLIKPNYKEKWEMLKKNKAHLFLILFYVLMALSYFWTEDSKTFSRLLQLKLSLILSALVWSSTSFTKKQIQNILFVFVGSIALHLSLDHILIYFNKANFNVHEFSIISKNRKHYIALFTLFSLGICSNYILVLKNKWSKIVLGLLSLFFTYNVLIIGSRIHILGLGVLSLYFIYQLIKSNISKTIIRYSVIGLIVTIGGITFGSERIQFKIEETKDEVKRIFDHTYSKNTNPRVYIWPDAVETIKENMIFGYGLGDAQNALNKRTDKIEIEFWLNGANTKLRDKNINAHSQFLEILLQTGVIGLLFFFASIFFGLKKPSQIFIIFSICVFLSMLTESVLERQFGLVFFAFFYPFLLQKQLD